MSDSDAGFIAHEAQLGDGHGMPWIGYGTFLSSADVVGEGCARALHFGYMHIDTAEAYRNEQAIGDLLAGKTTPLVPVVDAANVSNESDSADRKMPFITTKLWPLRTDGSAKSYDEVISSCEESLKKLQLPSVDLYLIHAPLAGPESRLQQWKALLQLKETGKCKSIGVSNYSIKHLEEIRTAGLPMPAANQLELHPLCQHRDIIDYCRSQGILPIAYSSLAPLSSWRPQQLSAKQSMHPEQMQQPELIDALAAKYRITAAQILLLWALQHGYPILPKSNSLERIQQNNIIHCCLSTKVLSTTDSQSQQCCQLSSEDMHALDALDQNKSFAWPKGDPCLTP